MKNFFFSILFFLSLHSNNKNHIYILSIPKSGTHLLMKLLDLLTNKKCITNPNNYYFDQLGALIPENFSATHLIFNEYNKMQLQNTHLKCLFIYRDPRDVIVSFAKFIPKIAVYSDLTNVDMYKLILILIENIAYIFGTIKQAEGPGDIDQFFRKNYLPWLNQKEIFCTTFEKLIGVDGGGNKEIQFLEIKKIAKFLNYNISNHEITAIAKNLFGGTFTFNEGKIGSWQKYFNPQHKELFKSVAGQLLIDLGYEKDFNW